MLIKEARSKVLAAEQAEATVRLSRAKRRSGNPAILRPLYGTGRSGLGTERRLRSLEQQVEQLSAELETLKKGAR